MSATKYTTVVVETFNRILPTFTTDVAPAGIAPDKPLPPLFGCAGMVEDVVLIAPYIQIVTVVPATELPILPHMSQSPAESDIEVMLVGTDDVRATCEAADIVADINSPTCPVAALDAFVTPVIVALVNEALPAVNTPLNIVAPFHI